MHLHQRKLIRTADETITMMTIWTIHWWRKGCSQLYSVLPLLLVWLISEYFLPEHYIYMIFFAVPCTVYILQSGRKVSRLFYELSSTRTSFILRIGKTCLTMRWANGTQTKAHTQTNALYHHLLETEHSVKHKIQKSTIPSTYGIQHTSYMTTNPTTLPPHPTYIYAHTYTTR